MEYCKIKIKKLYLAISIINEDENNEHIECLEIPEKILILIKNKSTTFKYLINKIKEYNNNEINNIELNEYINNKNKPKRKEIFNILKSYLINNPNRTNIINEYNNEKYQYEQEIDNKGKQYIYPNQIKAAEEIVNSFLNNNKKAISLIALPQVGKTGTFIYVSYLMASNPDNNKILNSKNIFIITGMSDTEWEKQTKNDMLPSFKNNVYHHGKLNQFNKNFKKTKGAKLLIIDESHIGIKQKQRIDKILCDILEINKKNNIKDIEDIKDIYILSVSATPGISLLDLEKFGKYHSKIYLEATDNYVGFKNFIDQERLEKCKQLTKEFLKKNILQKINERYNTPKYHIFRITSETSADIIKKFCEKNDFDYKYHNSSERDENFEENLKNEPEKHTFYLIKQFFRAGKRLTDTYIGIAYEYSAMIDMEKTPQGLVGRFCGNNKNNNKNNSPYFYCNN